MYQLIYILFELEVSKPDTVVQNGSAAIQFQCQSRTSKTQYPSKTLEGYDVVEIPLASSMTVEVYMRKGM